MSLARELARAPRQIHDRLRWGFRAHHAVPVREPHHPVILGDVDELRASGHVARGVDARIRRAKMIVEDRCPAVVHVDAGDRHVDRIDVRRPASRDQHFLGLDDALDSVLADEESPTRRGTIDAGDRTPLRTRTLMRRKAAPIDSPTSGS